MATRQQTQHTGPTNEAPLRATFGTPEAFGIQGSVPPETMDKVAKAILTVAASDGQLSKTEWERFTVLAARVGMPPQAIEGLSHFDAKNARLEDYLDLDTQPMAKVILFEAVKVARADGYGEKERQATRRVAERLHIEPEVVTAIEGLVEVEQAVDDARIRLLQPTLR